MQLGACGPHEWCDQYFEVTQAMLNVSDNLVFETELLFSESNLEAISLHLYKDGKIPLDRRTEFTSTTSSEGMYSIAIASIDLTVGVLYLSIHCGAEAQRFRSVVVEVSATPPFAARAVCLPT